MSKRNFAWSYSALTGFETCPRQYAEMRLLKRWPDPPGEVQLFGIESHKFIENRIDRGTPLPAHLRHIEPIVKTLEESKGEIRAEYKLALNQQLQPVAFFADDVWVRAVGDVVKIHEDRALLTDWKFGSFKNGDGQLRLQSAITFAAYPHVNKIGVVYVWSKDRKTTVRQFTREDVPSVWQEFMPRVTRMQLAIENKDFPPKPSGLCRKHCRVATCEFYEKGAY